MTNRQDRKTTRKPNHCKMSTCSCKHVYKFRFPKLTYTNNDQRAINIFIFKIHDEIWSQKRTYVFYWSCSHIIVLIRMIPINKSFKLNSTLENYDMNIIACITNHSAKQAYFQFSFNAESTTFKPNVFLLVYKIEYLSLLLSSYKTINEKTCI